MKILIIGGTGLIGSKTASILRQGGHDVAASSPKSGVDTITGEGLKEALAGTDLEAIKTSTETLLTASQSFSQRLYDEAAKESASAPGGEVPAEEANDDEVVDAEIVDEKG